MNEFKKITIKSIYDLLNSSFPIANQETWDQSGLRLFDLKSTPISKIILCLDCTKDIIDYAIENKEVKEWGEIKISEYFEVVKCESVRINECCDGNYPLISSCSGNNGICKFINSINIFWNRITRSTIICGIRI